MNSLITAAKKRTFNPGRNADVHNILVKKIKVRYRCPNNSDYIFSCPPDEIIPQNMYCNGCGKKHSWTPELTESDLAQIERIRAEARENAALVDAVESEAVRYADRFLKPAPDHARKGETRWNASWHLNSI